MESIAGHQLAQVSIARLSAPLAPLPQDFVEALESVNAVADNADGFVWRLRNDSGNATGFSVFGDEGLIVNLSVWRDVGALTAFMYTGRHRELLKRRHEWFERADET